MYNKMVYMSGGNHRRLTAVNIAIFSTGLVGGWLLGRAILRRCCKSSWYPRARRSAHTDEYFGHTVEDPYRWMEDPDADETITWVDAQVKLTNSYFKTELEPIRSKFRDRLEEVIDYDKYSTPWRVGDYWFFEKREGLSPQAVLFKQVGLDGTPEVLLNPNKLSADGSISLRGTYVSKDGKKLVYGLSKKGSDWFSAHAMDVVTGVALADRVDWCKFGSMTWEANGRGFFYSAFPRPEEFEAEVDKSAGTEVTVATGHRLMYHQLGTDSSDDKMVYQSPLDQKWLVSATMTDDWNTLLIYVRESTDPVNRLFYMDMSEFDGEGISTMGKIVKLVDNFESLYSYITNEGRTFWFRTNMDAPKYKIVQMQLPPVGTPMEEDQAALSIIPKVTVIPENDTGVLKGALAVAGDRLVLSYERNVVGQLEMASLSGDKRQAIDVPGIGTISGVSGDKEFDHLMFMFTNFVTPGIIYHGTVPKQDDSKDPSDPQETSIKLKVYRETEVPGINSDHFQTKQIRYQSKDGTMVPMFIVEEKNASGPAPCILYGYGGFNVSNKPIFSASRLLFIRHLGGRYCIANIRGGGEYGEEWHTGGTLSNKQNVFDDFAAAARYLTAEGYTTKEQLACAGGSNGGLLVGACINQHPELFAAAVAQVAVTDMLRFDKFTIGYAWRSDYGSSEASEEEFKTLRAYSPVHNVNPDSPPYPATLLCTGDHDDRVCPLHSYKYMAELQHSIGSRNGEKPLLIRIDKDCGHGGGKPMAKAIEEAADTYSFIGKHTDASWRP